MQQIVLWVCAFAVLGTAAWVTVLDSGQAAAAPTARRAFIDPETGEMAPPPPAQREAMGEDAAQTRAQRRGSAVTEPEVVRRDGVTMIRVPRSQWPKRHAVVGPDGEVGAPAHD